MTLPQTNVFLLGPSGQVTIEWFPDSLEITYSSSSSHAHALYVALDDRDGMGSPIVPFGQFWEGSTVFLPLAAKSLFYVLNDKVYCRTWKDYTWGERELSSQARYFPGLPSRLSIPHGAAAKLDAVVYVKDLKPNFGWGSLIGSTDPSAQPGMGDKTIGSFLEIRRGPDGQTACKSIRRSRSPSRIRIYELFVRLFGNVNQTRKCNGRLDENGCGKFSDINDAALSAIAEMNFTHVWLLGVVRHATATAYPAAGLKADDSDLMKGLAGSPYAIRDYFDIAPDLADKPERRMEEFRALLDRIHGKGLKVMVDLVANHVSRAYDSTVRPDLNFGAHDNPSVFFTPTNNYYYLSRGDEGGGPPLRLPTLDTQTGRPITPTCVVQGDCDGLFAGEAAVGRVTGNNRITWAPAITDWYETVKLNFGFDFRDQANDRRQYPNSDLPQQAIPDTWLKIDAVIEHWQRLGVDGFRCDMAHLIPPEFWVWSLARARARSEEVFFAAEAYNDSLVVPSSDPTVLALQQLAPAPALLSAGFDAVYGHDTYTAIRKIYMESNWANDIDDAIDRQFTSADSVCYAENHDEIRLASPLGWGSLGPNVGRPVSAILFGLGRGPILVYNGQEVGEPAKGAEGFSGDDGRTTIFDYWSMPELGKWVNNRLYDGAQLSEDQRGLRAYYGQLLALCGEPAFRDGHFFSLNKFNLDNPRYGRCDGETASGHWLYAFLRYDPGADQRFLVVANLHGQYTLEGIEIRLPEEATDFLQIPPGASVQVTERLSRDAGQVRAVYNAGSVVIDSIPALTAYYFSMTLGE